MNELLQKGTAPSAMLRTHWFLVLMDQYTRRIIAFGVDAGMVDGGRITKIRRQSAFGISRDNASAIDNN
jgi:hypothetical protein